MCSRACCPSPPCQDEDLGLSRMLGHKNRSPSKCAGGAGDRAGFDLSPTRLRGAKAFPFTGEEDTRTFRGKQSSAGSLDREDSLARSRSGKVSDFDTVQDAFLV